VIDDAGLSVLHVNTSDRGGGAESVALDLHRALIDHGINSRFMVGFRRSNVLGVIELPRDADVASLLYDAARAHGMPRLGRVARSLADPGVLADLARGREDFRFPGSHALLDFAKSVDVIHLHNLHGAYFDLRILPALSRLKPIVITLHDEWTLTGHCALTLGCERWRENCGSCPHLDVYPRLRRDGTAFNLNRKREIWSKSRLHVVAPTHWLLERAKVAILRGAATSWSIVSNGVHLEMFSAGGREAARVSLGIAPDALVISFAAAGAKRSEFKDLRTLERALVLLGASNGPPVVALTIGTPGETKRIGRVELRRIKFLERPDLARHFRASDLYVHPARAETQGLSLMEALATGLPAVASNVGGIPEVVRNGETGILVPPSDAHALAAAILELLNDPNRRHTMSHTAAEDARLRFAHDEHVRSYVRVYASELAKQRARIDSVTATGR
jgi:glycosyltransferase involved in cell wall biosynthesis